MNKILEFLQEHTGGTCYKSLKYCFDATEPSPAAYDDQPNTIKFNADSNGETDKGLKMSKSLETLAKKIQNDPPLSFRYFLDGSRRTYKIDDIAYNNRLYPIMAGQIGVGCCERQSPHSFKYLFMEKQLVLSLPDCADKDGKPNSFFQTLVKNLNGLPVLQKHQIAFQKVLSYSDEQLGEGEKYEHKGIAKIQNEMVELEKVLVRRLVQDRKLTLENYLLKDGSLEYSERGASKDSRLSVIKNQYQCVVGVSKTFNPEMFKDRGHKSFAKRIADLPLFHRTPACRYEAGSVQGVKFSVWYLRVRDSRRTVSPFEGVLKIEKILVTEKEQDYGLESDEIDLISANLLNERNPTCYGVDNRWANHLYPVYLTERFVKSQYLSDLYFLNLF